MMKRSQLVVATETEQQQQGGNDAQQCRNLLFEVLNRAVADLDIQHRRNDALTFFCSRHAETLARILGLDCEAIKAKLVPVEFRLNYERRNSQRLYAPTIGSIQATSPGAALASARTALSTPGDFETALLARWNTMSLYELEQGL
jgi:hypothetical protein